MLLVKKSIKSLAVLVLGCYCCIGASLVFSSFGSPEVKPGETLSFDIWVAAEPGEAVAGVSLLLQDSSRSGWFSITSNLDRTGSPLSEASAPDGYHPWPQLLGGPDGVNGFVEDGQWRGVDLGALHPVIAGVGAEGLFPLGRATLIVNAQASLGQYEISADEIITSWFTPIPEEQPFSSVTPLTLTVIPEPTVTGLLILTAAVAFVTKRKHD